MRTLDEEELGREAGVTSEGGACSGPGGGTREASLGVRSGRSGDQGGEEGLTGEIIGACIDVHRQLGPGLLESVYEQCLCHELSLRGLGFERQRPIPVVYKGVQLDCGFRCDLIVEQRVLVELKCTERLLPLHAAQLSTYLRLSHLDIGLLVNFNTTTLRQGIRRLKRTLPP